MLAVAAVIAFFVGQRAFSGLNVASGDPTAQLLQQDGVLSLASQDSDRDGLTDLEEVRYKTDPHNEDTDHDGFPDGVEVDSGYNPTAAPGDGVDQSVPQQTAVRDTSLLNSLGLIPVSEQVDGLNVGGVGGMSADELQKLAGSSVPATERLAGLEVDKLLAQTSAALPMVDPKMVKVRKNADSGDVETYLQHAFKLVQDNNPFPAGYSIETFLDDVSTGNRDMLERLKVALEVIDHELSAYEVPQQMLTVHVHALGIARGASADIQELLAAQDNPDATLTFIGRTVFLWNEIRALLKEVDAALKQ